MRFPPKAITVCYGEEDEFDCKNNHRCGKSVNFRLDNISTINYKKVVVLSYTPLRLESRKV